jgi:MFS family permease
VVAILEIGAFISSLLVGRIGDVIGRRRTILYGSAVFFVGGGLQTFANGMPMMMVGRIVAGLGVGALSTIVPVYQSEISVRKQDFILRYTCKPSTDHLPYSLLTIAASWLALSSREILPDTLPASGWIISAAILNRIFHGACPCCASVSWEPCLELEA